jgi:hypothetical protein
MTDFVAIKAELDADPNARGYAAMTDEEAAADMNVKYVVRTKSSVSGHELFAQTDPTEFTALADPDRQTWLALCAIDQVNVENSSPAVPIVNDIFGNPSITRTALIAYRDEMVSQATALGLGLMKTGYIRQARAL